MRRRTLLGLGATVGGGLALGTGAFTTVSARRSVSVSTAGDRSAFLTLRPGDSHGTYVDTDGGTASVALGGDGAGVAPNSQYSFDGLLEVVNRGTQPVFVWTSVDTSDTSADCHFYAGSASGAPLIDARAVAVGVGESVSLGLAVDTAGVNEDFEASATLNAASEAPVDTQPGGPGPAPDPIPAIQLDSVSSLLSPDRAPLEDESVIVATAESTATNADEDGNDDAVPYPADVPIPVAALDGRVFAVTGPFVASDTQFGDFGNEELTLNAYDRLLGGNGRVVHDETHGQFYTLSENGGDDFQAFARYAEANGYRYGKATDDLTTALTGDDRADAVVVTSPSDAFTETELDALVSFVDDGGAVFLHDQSDFRNFDATANLNEIASALGVGFRFNDDQVLDDENNTGAPFVPTTDEFATAQFPGLFTDRPGLGVDLDPTETYEVTVQNVTDGDTVDVEFPNGTADTVRVLGIDTPETGTTPERIQEYEGITAAQASDLKALAEDGGDVAATGASTYADDRLAGETVTLSFDPASSLRGDFGRLLGYLELPNGDAYNREAVADGWARVYSSGFSRHDDYWDAETAAREAGDGIWQLSDPAGVPEQGDDPVSTLFFPDPVAVSGGETVVESETGEPLVAVDEAAGVACVGGPLIDEGFEPAEAGDGEPTNEGTQPYPFLANLADYLADGGLVGRVVVDGGHGQFDADFALSAEDVAYFQRYLEGQSTASLDAIPTAGTTQFGDDAGPQLLDADGDRAAAAVVITTPTTALSTTERRTVADFAAAGGAVVLVGTAADGVDAQAAFDPLVSELGASVSFGSTAVTDGTDNLGRPGLPTTTAFTGPDELFEAFTPGDGSGGDRDPLAFDSASALLDADGASALTDDALVAVRSETTASVEDTDGNGDAVAPYDGGEIPLVAVDDGGVGAVVGLTAPFVSDEASFDLAAYPNESFLLRLFDVYADDTTVRWDGSHGQFYDLSRYSEFESVAAAAGYTLVAGASVPNTTDDTDVFVVTSPSEAFTGAERDALEAFVADGGLVVLVDQSDFQNFDETANLNTVAGAVGADFRFDDAQTVDGTNNAGQSFVPTTDEFAVDSSPGLFGTPAVTDVSGADEYVVVANETASAVDLEGYTLSDETTKVFTFPAATLAPGERAVVTTRETPAGAAPPAAVSFEWDEGFVWNDGGDTAVLRAPDGRLASVYTY